jgi:hypothetical protein
MATPPTFSTGQVLTSGAMNDVGLWLIQSVTVGSGASSVPVSDAFSAEFDQYKIVYTGGSCSAQGDLMLTLDSTITGYTHSVITTSWSNSPSLILAGTLNGSSWSRAGVAEPDSAYLNVDIANPFLAKRTIVWGAFVGSDSTRVGGSFSGFLADTTSYTDFTITPSTGTLTGGTVRVYGYRN